LRRLERPVATSFRLGPQVVAGRAKTTELLADKLRRHVATLANVVDIDVGIAERLRSLLLKVVPGPRPPSKASRVATPSDPPVETDPEFHAVSVWRYFCTARVFFVESGLVAVSVDSGQKAWRVDFPFSVATAASPLTSGNLIYYSAGYGVGAGLFQLDGGDEPDEVWY